MGGGFFSLLLAWLLRPKSLQLLIPAREYEKQQIFQVTHAGNRSIISAGKGVRMSNNMAKIAEARKTVEQLKLEVNIDRMKVSKAAADLLAYCEAHAKEDPLVTPVPSAENPFREKRLFCIVL
ncbi:guanine nucleotide-binding protein G(I)/G(S)/G(O) subunit gamma-8 isoform X3 [Hemicordylus capensis]|nr:guanine nucleotide-binding protein G(I)/G(S)/G(O) subunit gamma-8 isoform X3 [Hemicordylus capensis]